MNYTQYKSLIVNSTLPDWNYDDEIGQYLFLNDISITIFSENDVDLSLRIFDEPWLSRFPDKTGYRYVFQLRYNGNIIERFYTVSVDGGRSYIPYPNSVTHAITAEQYAIGKIINKHLIEVGLDFDDYLTRAGITVV